MTPNGNVVVEYTYDSWGKLISVTGSLASTIGVKNPLRYRGYYYDTETSLYYLQSRYYDPETGRFISRDSYLIAGNDIIQGTNMYAYCYNNPVMYADHSGEMGQHWYNEVSFVAKVIDIGIIVLTTGKSLVGNKAIKEFLKVNKKKIVKTVSKTLLKYLGSESSIWITAAIETGLTLFGTSIGDLIAKGFDHIDPYIDERYIADNGYIFN